MKCRESDVASTENPALSERSAFFREGAGTCILMKVLISSDLRNKKVPRSAFKQGQDTFYSD